MDQQDILNELQRSRGALHQLDKHSFFSGFLDGAPHEIVDDCVLIRSSLPTNHVFLGDDMQCVALDRRWFEQVHTLIRLMTEYNTVHAGINSTDKEEILKCLEAFKAVYLGQCTGIKIEQLTGGNTEQLNLAAQLADTFRPQISLFNKYQQRTNIDSEFPKAPFYRTVITLFAYYHEIGHSKEIEGTPAFVEISRMCQRIWDDVFVQLSQHVNAISGIRFEGDTRVIAHLLEIGSPHYDEQTSALVSMLRGLQDETPAKEIFADLYMCKAIYLHVLEAFEAQHTEFEHWQSDVYVSTVILNYLEANNILSSILYDNTYLSSSDDNDKPDFEFLLDFTHQSTARLNIAMLFFQRVVMDYRSRFHGSAIATPSAYPIDTYTQEVQKVGATRNMTMIVLQDHAAAQVKNFKTEPKTRIDPKFDVDEVRQRLLTLTGFFNSHTK